LAWNRREGVLTNIDSADGDHGAVDLNHGTIVDLLDFVGVADELVAGEDIL
jgi:hypothetical protein